jgi:SAM-dependent methyltransferase
MAATRPPELSDRSALIRQRRRAARAPALFLHEAAWTELQERLSEVNRSFTAPAVVTGFPGVWADVLPGARIVADDEVLALDAAAHDLVVHALCLHWATDPVGQLVQCRRALRPDGLFMGVLFGGQTLAELRACLAEAEVALCGGLSPRVLPMGEIRDLGALLQRAGFALPVADSVPYTVTYADAWALMRDLRAMGEANALASRRRSPTPRALFHESARRYAQAFPAGDGRIRAGFEMIWLTGWAPAESQPHPLRPGSAQVRLADALGVRETPLPDSVRSGGED